MPAKGLIGNPVKIGSGPAAVIPTFNKKGTFLATMATVPAIRNGKAAKKAGESEDLPEKTAVPLRSDRGVADSVKRVK